MTWSPVLSACYQRSSWFGLLYGPRDEGGGVDTDDGVPVTSILGPRERKFVAPPKPRRPSMLQRCPPAARARRCFEGTV